MTTEATLAITKDDLNRLTKPVLVEMTKIIEGQAGDYARLSKDHYIALLAMYNEDRLNDAYEAAQARLATEPVPAGPAAPAPTMPYQPAPNPGQDMEAALKFMQLMRATMGVGEQEVVRIVQEHMEPLGRELGERLKVLAAGIKPRVEKVVVKGANEIKVEGLTHPAFDRVAQLAGLRKNILLVGPAGCGKTQLAHQVAQALELPFSSISCSAGMSESQIFGYLLPIGEHGRFEYVESEFVRIYENGGVFLFDEIDAADENVLVSLNQALANGGFHLPQRTGNRYVKRHADFICIAAANTYGHGADMMYAGRNRLDGATLDRFRSGIVTMTYDNEIESRLCTPEVLAWGKEIRAKIEQLKLRRVMSTRAMIDFSEQHRTLGWGEKQWAESYFADWSKDELGRLSGTA